MHPGDKFGRLTLVSEYMDRTTPRHRRKWVCRCECGKGVSAHKADLVKGKMKSCGCLNAERLAQGRGFGVDLVGQRFGRLKVLARAGTVLYGRGKWPKTQWTCVCDCGKETTTTTAQLNQGKTLSCGCYTIEVNQTATMYSVLNKVRAAALRAGHVWSLPDAVALALLEANCTYCGKSPEKCSENTRFKRNGIDRIDSAAGYVVSNVVTACKWCNHMKSNRSTEVFKEHIRTASNFLNLSKDHT